MFMLVQEQCQGLRDFFSTHPRSLVLSAVPSPATPNTFQKCQVSLSSFSSWVWKYNQLDFPEAQRGFTLILIYFCIFLCFISPILFNSIDI